LALSNHIQPPVNPFVAQQQMLIERLNFLLAGIDLVLRTDVIQALEGAGKLLSQPEPQADHPDRTTLAGLWPLLTLLVAQYISPDIDTASASCVAVAVECFVCALDLLDDVIDEDQTPTLQTLGVARTLNVSIALLTLAQQAILSLSQQDVAPLLIIRLLNTLQESALVITAGEHQDVLAEKRPVQDFTLEDCIEIARAKAGLIMRLACRLGALCAGADDKLCEQFSEMGELLGIAHQLDNDSHDLYYLLQSDTPIMGSTESETAAGGKKSDLIRGKKTLPVVLAAKMQNTLQNVSLSADEENEEYLRTLREGIITTWGICQLYRERARDRLHEIEARKSVALLLRLLLDFE